MASVTKRVQAHRDTGTLAESPCDGCGEPRQGEGVQFVAGEFPNLARLCLCARCARLMLERLTEAIEGRRSG